MGKPQLLQKLDPVPLAPPHARSRPFADTINREHRGAFEGRRKKGRGGVGFVVFRENNRAFKVKLLANGRLEPDLFFHPDWHRLEERAQAARRAAKVGGKQPFEFQKRLFVERDEIELGGGGQVSLAQAVIDGVERQLVSGELVRQRVQSRCRCSSGRVRRS